MGISRSCDLQMGGSQASQLVRRCDGRGRGGCRGLSRTVVDNPPHIQTGAGMTWQGWKEVNHPSMGSGWHAQICTGLSTKGVVRELYEGSHGLQQGMAVNECTIQHVSWILVEYTLSEC